MTLIFSESFAGGSNGALLTPANSAFDNFVSAAGFTFANTPLIPSTPGTLVGRASTSSANTIAEGPFASTATPWETFYLYVDVYPAAMASFADFRGAGALRCELRLGPNGNLQLRNSASTQVGTAPAGTVPLRSWCRIGYRYNTTTGQQQVRVFTGTNLHGTTPDYDSGLVTTTAAGNADALQLGVINAQTATLLFGYPRVDNAAFPGPIVTSTTADAGPNQDNIEPWSTVTLTGSDVGTITGRAWTQTSGPAVTLTGASTASPTFVAPATIAGASLGFSYTVTDSSSGTASDTTTVAVLPVTERAVIGGVEVPMQVRLT